MQHVLVHKVQCHVHVVAVEEEGNYHQDAKVVFNVVKECSSANDVGLIENPDLYTLDEYLHCKQELNYVEMSFKPNFFEKF